MQSPDVIPKWFILTQRKQNLDFVNLSSVPDTQLIPLSLKGHWTTSASSPDFFFRKVYTYVETASYLKLQLGCKDIWIFLAAAIFKSRLLKMAANVMTVEFDTFHHYHLVGRKILKVFLQLLEQIQKKTNWIVFKLRHFDFQNNHVLNNITWTLHACLKLMICSLLDVII